MKNLITLILAGAVSFICFASSANGQESIRGSEIKELLSGSTVVGIKFDNSLYEKTYYPDGTWRRVSQNGNSNVGKWRINEQDQYCEQKNGLLKETCSAVKGEGGIFTNYKEKVTTSSKGKELDIVAVWTVKAGMNGESQTALLRHKALATKTAAGK